MEKSRVYRSNIHTKRLKDKIKTYYDTERDEPATASSQRQRESGLIYSNRMYKKSPQSNINPVKKDTDDAGPPSKRSKDSLSSDSGRSSGDDYDTGSSVPTVESPREILDRISRHCSCTVCLDIPRVHLYQCKNGHLMCATCLGHLLADARLKDEVSSCPNCRCDISWDRCVRNLAAEKAVGELPTQCLYCSEENVYYFSESDYD